MIRKEIFTNGMRRWRVVKMRRKRKPLQSQARLPMMMIEQWKRFSQDCHSLNNEKFELFSPFCWLRCWDSLDVSSERNFLTKRNFWSTKRNFFVLSFEELRENPTERKITKSRQRLLRAKQNCTFVAYSQALLIIKRSATASVTVKG